MHNNPHFTVFYRPMEWTMKHDILLCREILVCEPYNHRKGSNERGKTWTQISDTLNSLKEIRFKVSQRGVRERFERQQKRFKDKMRDEERATGISPEESELDTLLEEITDKEKVAEESRDNEPNRKKVETDKKTAEEMRKEAMERFGETKKRSEEEGSEETKTKKRKRRTGNEAVEFLREKGENEHRLRQEELALKRDQLAQENARQDQLIKQQTEMFNLQTAMMQQQQQQTFAIMSLLDKMINKQ